MTQKVLWTGDEILEELNLEKNPSLRQIAVTGMALDHRLVQPGDLFMARRGDAHDGHQYMAQALEKGAVAVLGTYQPEGIPAEKIFLVPDTHEALCSLGRAGRARCEGKILGVTGSVGKTSVKEALAHLLSFQGKTVSSPKSYNNQVGLPYSLCYLQKDTQFGVFEMGMNHAGEIRPLSHLARPHCVLITTVEAVHLENFSCVEEIAAAKAEILEGVSPGGVAVLNRDNPHWAFLENKALEKNLRIMSFGKHPQAHARLIHLMSQGAQGTQVTLELEGRVWTYHVPLPGSHHGFNSLAVMAAVAAIGADVEKATQAMATLPSVGGRGTRFSLPYEGGEVLIIDESYNANPVSVRAALRVLEETPVVSGGRRVAVLGDMLELGPQEKEWHEGLVDVLAASGIHMVMTCGPLMERLFQKLPVSQRGFHAEESETLAREMKKWIQPGDVLMIKGSRGMKMERVFEALQ